MPMEITFELSDDDLEYFRKVMREVLDKTTELDETEVIANARKLLAEVSQSDTSDWKRRTATGFCRPWLTFLIRRT